MFLRVFSTRKRWISPKEIVKMVSKTVVPSWVPKTAIDLKVYGDRLLITLDPLVTEYRIKDPETGRELVWYLPEVHSERTRIATIRAVGDNTPNFKVGDKIIVSWSCGNRLHLIDKTVFGQIWDEDLLRVIRTEEVVAAVAFL